MREYRDTQGGSVSAFSMVSEALIGCDDLQGVRRVGFGHLRFKSVPIPLLAVLAFSNVAVTLLSRAAWMLARRSGVTSPWQSQRGL